MNAWSLRSTWSTAFTVLGAAVPRIRDVSTARVGRVVLFLHLCGGCRRVGSAGNPGRLCEEENCRRRPGRSNDALKPPTHPLSLLSTNDPRSPLTYLI